MEDIVSRVLSEIPDTNGVVNERLWEIAHDLHGTIQAERKAQDLRPYTSGQTAVFLQGLINAATFHKGDKRKTGETVLEGHLAPSVRDLVTLTGITGVVPICSTLLHDAKEDRNVPLEELLPEDQLKEMLRKFSDPHLDTNLHPREIENQVRRLVDGLTKVKNVAKSREERQAETFLRLLETVRDYGPRVIAIKAAGDRMSNIPTLHVKTDEARTRILDETDKVYRPLLIILDTRRAVEELIRRCIKFSNPSLAGLFQGMVASREQALQPHREKILDAFSLKSRAIGEERKFIPGIVDVSFREPYLSEYLPPDIPLREMDEESPRVNTLDPMFEVVVLVESEEAMRQIIPHILNNFLGRGPERNLNQPVRRGVLFYFRDPRYGGNVRIRINVTHLEARSKRGLILPGSGQLPDDVARAIAYTIGKTHHLMGRRNGTPRVVFDIARREFLHPRKQTFTRDGTIVELPHHATYLDFARQVHEHMLVGLGGATITSDLYGTQPQQKVFIFDEVPEGAVVTLQSCLAKGKQLKPGRIQVDPGWLIFCTTQSTRDTILDFLRHPFSFYPDFKTIREQSNLKILEENMIVSRGEGFLQRITSLLHLQSGELIQILREQYPELENLDDRKLAIQVGRGSFDMLRFLAKYFEGTKKWGLTVSLPDIPGALNAFTRELGEQGINIDDIRFDQGNRLEGAELRSGYLTLSDSVGRLAPEDFLKIFLKYSYQGYHIRIEAERQ